MQTAKVKQYIFYLSLLAAAAGLAVRGSFVPYPGLEQAQFRAAVLLCFALVNWILETVPVAVTSLIVIALIPFSGTMTFSEAVKGSFGSSIFAFFLGTLILSEAFKQTNLGKIIAHGLLSVFGKTPRSTILAVMAAGAFLAMWVTEVAAAAIVFPIALSIANQSEDGEKRKRFGKAMMLAVAWGCAFGGVATPIATGANLIALNYLEQYGGVKISFLQWMTIGIPISVTLLAAGWLLLSRIIKDNGELKATAETPAAGIREKKLTVIFASAVLLWIFGGKIGLGSHQTALMAAITLFLPGIDVLEWKKTIGAISWDSIMLICSGVLIGDLLYKCGLAKMMAGLFFSPAFLRQGIFLSGIYVVLTVSVLKIMFSSNTVTGVVLVPIMIMLAEQLHMSAWQLVAPCIFSSALSLVIITSSPVNVIPYSAKYFTPLDMLRYGIPMTVISAVVIGAWLKIMNVC